MAIDLDFTTFIQDLQDIGFYNYFLPFVLIFAITFALLENSKILGEKKNVNVIISMVIGFILIAQQPIVEIINLFLQKSSLIIVVILVALLVIFLVSGSSKLKGGVGAGIIILIILLSLVWALSPQMGLNFPFWSGISDRTKNLILMLILFFIIPIIITSRKREGTDSAGTKFFKGLSDMFEKRD